MSIKSRSSESTLCGNYFLILFLLFHLFCSKTHTSNTYQPFAHYIYIIVACRSNHIKLPLNKSITIITGDCLAPFSLAHFDASTTTKNEEHKKSIQSGYSIPTGCLFITKHIYVYDISMLAT